MTFAFKEHPSFGQIRIAKTQSSGSHLFGSKVEHRNYVSIEIHSAKVEERVDQDFVADDKLLLRFSMSEAQWAHMVSSFNGSGTPVTLKYRVDTGGIPDTPAPTPIIDQAKKEMTDTKRDLLKRFSQFATDVAELLDAKAPARKKTVDKLRFDIDILKQHFTSNLDYQEEKIVERMELEVAKAQTEIEASAQAIIRRIGDRAIGAHLAAGGTLQLEQLTEGPKE